VRFYLAYSDEGTVLPGHETSGHGQNLDSARCSANLAGFGKILEVFSQYGKESFWPVDHQVSGTLFDSVIIVKTHYINMNTKMIQARNYLAQSKQDPMNKPTGENIGLIPLARESSSQDVWASPRLFSSIEASDALDLVKQLLESQLSSNSNMESSISELRNLILGQRTIKDWYSTQEIAALASVKPRQVQKWCREERIECRKRKGVGRGDKEEWEIPHAGLEYYRNNGLKPRFPN